VVKLAINISLAVQMLAFAEGLLLVREAGAATAGLDVDDLRSSWCPPATVAAPWPGASQGSPAAGHAAGERE
jgi:hypothetical protein